jgi:hypothetical protein
MSCVGCGDISEARYVWGEGTRELREGA